MLPRLVDVVQADLVLVDHLVQADLVDLVGMHLRPLPVNLLSHLWPMRPQLPVHEPRAAVLFKYRRTSGRWLMKKGQLLLSNQVAATAVPFSSNPLPCLEEPIQLVELRELNVPIHLAADHVHGLRIPPT